MVERFGRYVLLERIAQGGMAEVFRAASVGTDGFSKLLAVKRILPHLAADRTFVTMLIDEAKIAATLNHPNVLQVLDLGRENGVYFIAMEFVAGQALNNVVAQAIRAQHRLAPGFCFHVIAQALHGLAYAHNKMDATGQPMGIIHRDVSPQNLMVAYDGAVRIADFGIAKAAERSTETLTGSLKGKPAYMSPEQVQGKPIDHRLDLYAMGVVLHELLAMKRMRKAKTDVQILLDVAKGDFPRFEALGVDIPPQAAALVYRALEPEPKDRWQSADAFAHALGDTARALGWHYGAPQVSQVMQKLFTTEIEHERVAQNTFQAFVQELSAAGSDEVSNLIAQRAPELDEVGGMRTVHTPTGASGSIQTLPTMAGPLTSVTATNARNGQRATGQFDAAPPAPSGAWKAIVALGGLLLLGAAGAFGWTQLRTSSGQLIVETTPPGARISVGGMVQEGVSPVVTGPLNPGPVEVTAELPGMIPIKDVFNVEAGGTVKVKLTLSVREVLLPVTSDPSGASVTVDGKPAGETPLTVTLTGASRVTVRLEMAGYVPVQQQIDPMKPPTTLDLALSRREDRTPPPRNDPPDRDKPRKAQDEDGMLTLRSEPWARLFIDGKDTGRFTPVAEMPLPAGKHTIKLVNDEENLSASFSLTIKAGQKLNLSKELQ